MLDKTNHTHQSKIISDWRLAIFDFRSVRYVISHVGSRIIEARNDVAVIIELGEQLNTEELVWDQNKEINFQFSSINYKPRKVNCKP